jgi:UDP-glucose 4-epimerase
MKILFTGASSFTGYWFVKTLAAAGHEVIAPLQGAVDGYDGVRKERVGMLESICKLVPRAAFGSDEFLRVIRDDGPWDLLCHHAAYAVNYKSPDFNVLRALESNTLNSRAVLAALQGAGLKAVVLTGTVFENDEGVGNEPMRAFSGYGLSKGLTYQAFRFHCGQAGVPLAKFVIPNPFGPYEEARFTAYLMRTWSEGKSAGVKTPLYVRDNIPADLLARAYIKFAERAATGSKFGVPPSGGPHATPPAASAKAAAAEKGGTPSQPLIKTNPSGYIESQGAFALRVARETQARLGLRCDLELARQEDFSEPLMRANHEPAQLLFPDWDEKAFWDEFISYYASRLAKA